MEFRRLTLRDCAEATGVVVVIDVLRAFTTAAHAFAAGAREIVLVSSVEEALALRGADPDALIMGEVGGLKPAGFDLGNSPTALIGRDLAGRRLIQRTSAGTQGVVGGSARAGALFGCSLCCAAATARHIRRLAPAAVSFVITGVGAGSPQNDGDEDVACADYVEALLRGETPDTAAIVRRVHDSYVARKFLDLAQPDFPAEDLAHCAAIDRFAFSLPIHRRDGRLVMRCERA